VVERRFAEAKAERMSDIAAELVRLKVDVIVTSTDPAIAAVRQQTQTIPIVMANSTDPVATGFVASLSRPGGNVTGVFSRALEIGAKALLARECTLTSPTVARQTTSIGFCAARRLPWWQPAKPWRTRA